MAQETVVKDQLPAETIWAGDELTRELHQRSDFGLVASFWSYSSESNQWRLFIGTPLVETRGPLFAYNILQGVLADNWQLSLALRLYTISVLRPQDPVIRALRSWGAFEIQDLPPGSRPTPTVRVPLRIAQSRVQDLFIEDALVYFLSPLAA